MGSGKKFGKLVGKVAKVVVDPIGIGSSVLGAVTGSNDMADATKEQTQAAEAAAKEQAAAAANQAQAIRDQTTASLQASAQQQQLLQQQANQQAQASAQAAALAAQKEQASASAAEVAAKNSTPLVTLGSTDGASKTRRKYNANSLGGTSGGGGSIRV